MRAVQDGTLTFTSTACGATQGTRVSTQGTRGTAQGTRGSTQGTRGATQGTSVWYPNMYVKAVALAGCDLMVTGAAACVSDD